MSSGRFQACKTSMAPEGCSFREIKEQEDEDEEDDDDDDDEDEDDHDSTERHEAHLFELCRRQYEAQLRKEPSQLIKDRLARLLNDRAHVLANHAHDLDERNNQVCFQCNQVNILRQRVDSLLDSSVHAISSTSLFDDFADDSSD
jgi:ABC-type Zn2+ transport system substrate-binding protein/surface adhesin